MNKNALTVSLLLVFASLSGCAKRSDRSATTAAQQAAPDTSAVSKNTPASAMVEDISFLNKHFVISDNSGGRFEPTGFRVDESHAFFEFDYTDPGKPKTHFVESALATDLDPDSVRADFVGWLHVVCKNQKPCVSQSGTAAKNELIVGPIAEVHSDEAKQHLKRILLGCAMRPDQTAEAAAPSQEQARSTSASAPERDPIDGAEVRVAESHVSADGIRVIVARNETTGRAVFFACKTVMDGGLIDHTRPQPKLRITYTLEPLAGSSVTYWMNPRGDDDRDDGKHLLVRPFTPN